MANFFDTPEQTGMGGIHEGCHVRANLLLGENARLKRQKNWLLLVIVQVVICAVILVSMAYSRSCEAADEQAGVASGVPSNIQAHPARPGWSKVPEAQTEPSKPAPVVSTAVVPKSRRFLGIDYSYWFAATLLCAVAFIWFNGQHKPKD